MEWVRPSITVIEERLVYANSYGRLYDDDVRFEPGGALGTYVRWDWDAPYSVAVLPTQAGSVTLIRSFRHASRTEVLEVPKGFGEEGVEPVEMARRELHEETGLVAREIRAIGRVSTDPGFVDHGIHLFLASDYIFDRPSPEPSEAIAEVVTLELSEALAAVLESPVVDAVTLLLLHAAATPR
jgi:8-oxo-dGTP pyrophosphatase MutT (NUDIX family)